METMFYGWFDDASQTEPTYDPGLPAPCPYCGSEITDAEDCRTHCVMAVAPSYAKRSYFYRTHKTCDERHRETHEGNERVIGMDGFILDMIARNGD